MTTSRPEVFRGLKERNSAMGIINRFPSKPMPHTILFVFKEYSYEAGYAQNQYAAGTDGASGLINAATNGRRGSGVGIRSEKSVELPFPKQLQDSSNITLNGISRDPLVEQATNYLNKVAMGGSGTLGDLPSQIQSLGAGIAQKMAGGSGDGIGTLFGDAAKALGATSNKDAALIARYLLQKVSPLIGDVGQSINLAAGQVLNPKETLVFEGVQLRAHQFSWELFPESPDDSARINSIIRTLKQSTLPQTIDFKAAGFDFNRAFLKFPHVVYTYLLGVDNNSFMKFKPAMVTNVTIDYGAGGMMAILKGGKPAGVTINLAMQELSIETAEDYGAESLAANQGMLTAESESAAAEQDRQDAITSASAG